MSCDAENAIEQTGKDLPEETEDPTLSSKTRASSRSTKVQKRNQKEINLKTISIEFDNFVFPNSAVPSPG